MTPEAIARSNAKMQALREKGAALAVTDVLGETPFTDGADSPVVSAIPNVVLTSQLAQSNTVSGCWFNLIAELLERGQRSKLPAAS